ncbi:MAG: DUF2238 domain-containing protein [Rubricoccaceae bacterium]|nr:DUF2238 domain-containing protein [Rubricoccaceae bacterium]
MPLRKPRSVFSVAVFTLIYLLTAVVGAIATGSREFLFYIAIMIVLIGAVWAVHRRVNLTHATLWCLSIWGLLHMMGGLLTLPNGWPYDGESAVLYNWWLIADFLKYDHVVHAFGFGVTTWVCWQGIRSIIRRTGGSLTPTFGQMVLSWACGLGFGAVNEVVEFVAVLMVPNTNVGGYINTGWDLVANMAGATLAAILIYVTNRP